MGGIDYLRLDKTKDKSYAFDHAFDHTVSQKAVFEGTAQRSSQTVQAAMRQSLRMAPPEAAKPTP